MPWIYGTAAFKECAADYPDVQTDYAHVDAICMWMVKNPEYFDVIVTDNMFGDIITDLGAMIQGGMGIAAGGNINPEGTSMFEPIGGSAPKYTGLNKINPLAAICSAQMMLEHLEEKQAAARILDAVKRALQNDIKSLDAGKMGLGTKEIGDLVAKYVKSRFYPALGAVERGRTCLTCSRRILHLLLYVRKHRRNHQLNFFD